MLIHERDNVSVDLNNGNKYAICAIPKGENVIKYGWAIGHAIKDIVQGELVHTHNMKSNYDDSVYRYISGPRRFPHSPSLRTFTGYRRENGTVGIRNDIWIINMDEDCKPLAEQLSKMNGALQFSIGEHLQDDPVIRAKILRGVVNHPNAGGVLVIGRGETIAEVEKTLGKYDPRRVRFLRQQATGNEISGAQLIKQLKIFAAASKPEQIPLFHLIVGLKCGDGDRHSDLVENPLVGRFFDKLICRGGSCLLTEISEMFGAEHLLLERCVSKAVFEKAVAMLRNFKDRCKGICQSACEEYTSGMTTLEEQTLSHLQKAGFAPVVDVLDCGQRVRENGLSLLGGTDKATDTIINLIASGAHMILLTADSAALIEPLVPIVRIGCEKDGEVDFDVTCAQQTEEPVDALFDYVMQVASGLKTANET